MRQIYIVLPRISSEVVVYDGPEKLGHRKEYISLQEFLEQGVRDLRLNTKKPVDFYLKCANGRTDEVRRDLSRVFSKAKYVR